MKDRLILKRGRDSSVLGGHPWLFSGAIAAKEGAVEDGSLVGVYSADGRFLAAGHFGGDSISVRILAREPISDIRGFLTHRIARCIAVRRALDLERSGTSAYRLINAEGDGLSGLVVDCYGEVLVLQCHSAGMKRWKSLIVEVLCELIAPSAIVDRSPEDGARAGGRGASGRVPSKTEPGGREPSKESVLYGSYAEPTIEEYGLRFPVDCLNGQKTGFFLDQRENRRLLERYAAGRRVLNAFCYTGGFSVYALRGGAESVTSVDISPGALGRVAQTIEQNALSGTHFEIEADCMQFLKDQSSEYDLVILDPPAFVKHRGAKAGGSKGYSAINYQALAALPPGGLLFTFSCSAFISRDELGDILRKAAARAGRSVRVLHQLGAAPCHPVHLAHPEGEYLKGFVLAVD